MRATLLGLLVGIGVTALTFSDSEPHGAFAQGTSRDSRPPEGEIIALLGAVTEGQQVVLLIDPEERSLGSYHVDVKSGQVALRSVRDFRWDLQMDEFNGKEPSPEQIKALLRSR